MNVRAVPRNAVNGYLKAVRLPIDIAERVAMRGANEPSVLSLTADKVESGLRAAAATVLRDDELADQARRQRLATDERVRAIRLRAEAAERSAEADARLADEHERAERMRLEAEAAAEQERARLERERQVREQRAAERAAKKKATTRRVIDAKEEEIGGLTVVAAAEQLEQEAEVLDLEKRAATARKAARSTAEAAQRAKSARKSRTS